MTDDTGGEDLSLNRTTIPPGIWDDEDDPVAQSAYFDAQVTQARARWQLPSSSSLLSPRSPIRVDVGTNGSLRLPGSFLPGIEHLAAPVVMMAGSKKNKNDEAPKRKRKRDSVIPGDSLPTATTEPSSAQTPQTAESAVESEKPPKKKSKQENENIDQATAPPKAKRKRAGTVVPGESLDTTTTEPPSAQTPQTGESAVEMEKPKKKKAKNTHPPLTSAPPGETTKSVNVYICDRLNADGKVCEKKYLRMGHLLNHYLVHDGCDYIGQGGVRCGQKVYQLTKSSHRCELHTPENGKEEFICDRLNADGKVCEKKYLRKADLVEHYRVHDGCDYIGQGGVRCGQKVYQRSHRCELHTLENEKEEFICDRLNADGTVCEKKYLRRSELNRHYQVHDGCNYIGQDGVRCGQQVGRSRHHRCKLHTVLDFSCDFRFDTGDRCTQSFRTEVLRDRHKAGHTTSVDPAQGHFGQEPGSVEKPFKCDFLLPGTTRTCSKRFREQEDLGNHKRDTGHQDINWNGWSTVLPAALQSLEAECSDAACDIHGQVITEGGSGYLLKRSILTSLDSNGDATTGSQLPSTSHSHSQPQLPLFKEKTPHLGANQFSEPDPDNPTPFECSDCGHLRGPRYLHPSSSIDTDPVCTYCVNKITDNNLAAEFKWCHDLTPEGHNAQREFFRYDDAGKLDLMQTEHMICLGCVHLPKPATPESPEGEDLAAIAEAEIQEIIGDPDGSAIYMAMLNDIPRWQKEHHGRYMLIRDSIFIPWEENGETSEREIQEPGLRQQARRAAYASQRSYAHERAMMGDASITDIRGHEDINFHQLQIIGDGNCAWRSASAVLFGHQQLWRPLRRIVRRYAERATDWLGQNILDGELAQHRMDLYEAMNARTNGVGTDRRSGTLKQQLFGGDKWWGSAELIQVIADAFPSVQFVIHAPSFSMNDRAEDTVEWSRYVFGPDGGHQFHLINYMHTGHWQALFPTSNVHVNAAGGVLDMLLHYDPHFWRFTAHQQDPDAHIQRDPLQVGNPVLPVPAHLVNPEADYRHPDVIDEGSSAAAAPQQPKGDDDDEHDMPSLTTNLPVHSQTVKAKILRRSNLIHIYPTRADAPARQKLLQSRHSHQGQMTGSEAVPADYIVYGQKEKARVVSMNDSGPAETVESYDNRFMLSLNPPKNQADGDHDELANLDGMLIAAYRAPEFWMFGRFSDPRNAQDVLQALQSHVLVLQDHFVMRGLARLANRPLNVRFVPYPVVEQDFWMNGIDATREVPVFDDFDVNPENARLIQCLDAIAALPPNQRPTLYWIIRGISGLSVGRSYDDIRTTYPMITIRVIHAFRDAYMADLGYGVNTNVEFLMQGVGQNPTPPSARNMWYSKEIGIADLAEVEEDSGMNLPAGHDAAATELYQQYRRAKKYRLNKVNNQTKQAYMDLERDRNGYI